MSESNAHHFHKAWKSLSVRASEAHHDYMIARDVASAISKPKVKDFPGTKDVVRAKAQMEMYNSVQQRVRYYKQRWVRLDSAAQTAFATWVDMESKND